MPTQLKPVDVAVIGLGAAGGVAVLPLARAGLKVAGIEAGTWMGPKDYRADEIYNNVRRRVTSVPKAMREIPTARANPSETARPAAPQHPMMNAIGGTSIHYWAQSWRLKPWDFSSRSEIIRRYGAARAARRLDARRLASHLRRTGTFLRHHRVGSRRLRESRQYPGQARSARQYFRRPAPPRISHAGAAQHRVHRSHVGNRAPLGLASVPPSRRDQ